MKLASNILASGPGWRVTDVVCHAGPNDRPVEEQHDAVCIAAVTAGTFQYRTANGAAVLAPGAMVLGNKGHCFECGHEHAIGDRCLAFHFTPEYWEEIVAAVPGAKRSLFGVPHLPPSLPFVPLIAAVEAARHRDVRPPLAMRPGKPLRRDSEYERGGTANVANLVRRVSGGDTRVRNIRCETVGICLEYYLF